MLKRGLAVIALLLALWIAGLEMQAGKSTARDWKAELSRGKAVTCGIKG